MVYRVLTLDEFLGACDDAIANCFTGGTRVDVRLLEEARLRLMEMESDMIRIKEISEVYDYE